MNLDHCRSSCFWRYSRGSDLVEIPPCDNTAGRGERCRSCPKAAKNSIILADFINHTGDPVFDTTLNQALQIDLEQSPVINIVSQQHLAQSVKYLGKPEGTTVTPEIAREIGVREGVKAIITGTIANLGKQYVVTLTAQNTATGDEIVSEQAQAADKEHVLDALGKAAAAIRGKLGRIWRASRSSTPLRTGDHDFAGSLSRVCAGDKAHVSAHDIPEAEGHYLRAIELDPNFAMAYARLGVVYINATGGQGRKVLCQGLRAFEQCERAGAALHHRPLLSERNRRHAQSGGGTAGVHPNLPHAN